MRTARPEPTYDVVIVGAALAGCATARALAMADGGRGRRILVLDRHRGAHPRFSGEFIHPRGAQILDELGFYEPLRSAGAIDADGFVVFENADGRAMELPYGDIPGQRSRGLSIHHKVLVSVLREQLATLPSVDLCEGWTVVDLVRTASGRITGVNLKDATGATASVHCDLLIGADGKGSTVRKLAGVGDGRETIGFTLGIEVEDAALPWPTHAHVFLGAWGPMLAYPILRRSDGRIVSRVTFDLPRHLPVKGRRLAQHVLSAYIPFLPPPLAGQTAATIERLGGTLDIAPTVNLPAPAAVRPGLALVGDAAGCSHPITASGMTMGLRDAELFGREGRRRCDVPLGQPWFDADSLRRYRSEHDRYVPTRQALADAIYEAFRGEREGSRAIRRALFRYWSQSPDARRRSMALLSCVEKRPHVFLTEYLRTARHAVESSVTPRHAQAFPLEDRFRQVRGAVELATDKLGMVARVMWAQVRPAWLPHADVPTAHFD